MEVALESFKNLTEEQKVKFFEALVNSSSPTKCEQSKECLKDLCLQSDESKKGQKTLDNWLLNRNLLLRKHKQPDANASNYNPATNVFSSSSLPAEEITNNVDLNYRGHDISVNKVCIKDSKVLGNYENSKGHLEREETSSAHDNIKLTTIIEETSPTHDNIKLTTSTEETSAYNLRSKRKKVKVSYFEEDDNKSINNETNSAELDCIDNKNYPIPSDIEIVFDSNKNNIQKGDVNLNSVCDDLSGTNRSLNTKKRKSPQFQSSRESRIYSEPLDVNNHVKQLKSNNKDVSADTTCLISEVDCEAFHKLKEACSEIQLDIHELLQQENIQNLFTDKKYNDDSIIFIGSHHDSTGKVLPVVHAHKSGKLLSEKLTKMVT